MTIVVRIIGALTGATFGLVTCFELLPVLCGGNLVAAGFLFLPGALVSLVVGGVAGAIAATRIAKCLRENPVSVAQRRSHRVIVLALILGVPGAFAAVVWGAKEAMRPPSDSTMLRHFEQHEAIFETLAQMASSDKGINRVDENWTMPTDTNSVGVSNKRLADYRTLLRQAEVPRGFQITPAKDGFKFFYWLVGSAISDDTEKGFAYLTTPPATTVQTLDGIRITSRDPFTAYRHIHGNWYLFYDFTPD